MKAVMYHYVRPGPDGPPFEYYYLGLEDFRRQLDHFQSEYELVDREVFLGAVAGRTEPPDDGVILTFDDGLVDHYEHVLPELRARGLWGLFFVPGPLGEDALPVHRIHTLLGTADATAIDAALRETVDLDDVREGYGEAFERMYADMDSDAATARIKETLNYLLPYDRLPAVLSGLEERFLDYPVVTEDLYLSGEQIGALSDAGMLVGGHTVRHRVLSRLPPADQRSEIEQSLAYVEEAAGQQPVRSFAYPYGDPETFDKETVSALRAVGCDVAFTTEPRDIAAGAFETAPLQLPRWDCNEFPHGDASRY